MKSSAHTRPTPHPPFLCKNLDPPMYDFSNLNPPYNYRGRWGYIEIYEITMFLKPSHELMEVKTVLTIFFLF